MRVAHPGLFRELDYELYRVEPFRCYSVQHAPIRPARAEDAAGRVNTALRGDDRTLTLFEWYFADPGQPDTWNNLNDSMAFSDQIQQEDIQLCEDVWRNLQTGVYDRGRFSVKRENGVHHFQGLVSEFLSR